MLCPINGWDDWTKKLMEPASRSNAMFVQAAKDWAALKPSSLATYLYYDGYGWPGPIPATRTVADRMQHYRELGIEGVFLPGVRSWGPAGLDLYMFSRLAWNPDLDVDLELDLYYTNYYGPAARPMKAYHERLMDAFELPAAGRAFEQSESALEGGGGARAVLSRGKVMGGNRLAVCGISGG